MSVKLRKRSNKDGTTSLVLDIYDPATGSRKRKFLNHLKLCKAANPADRVDNRDNLRQAEAIAITLASELQANDYNMVSEAGKKVLMTVWMQSYIDHYKKADVRTVQGVLNRFIEFLKEEKMSNLTFGNLTALIIEDFMEFLESKSIGEGANSYYKRFKKMIRQAYRQRMLKENPLDYVERKMKGKAKKKDVLTLPELEKLAETKMNSPEVRRAFLFCCSTGLRWCDVKSALKWRHIDLENKQINKLRQSKTEIYLTAPLNDTALALLGEEKGTAGDLVFSLPSDNGANKTLEAWIKRAGIDKKITWHNARHSYGTNLILSGAGILTVSQVLGQTSVKHTQRYVDTDKDMKRAASKKVTFKIDHTK